MAEECSGARAAQVAAARRLFYQALLNLGELHDREVQALCAQEAPRSSLAEEDVLPEKLLLGFHGKVCHASQQEQLRDSWKPGSAADPELRSSRGNVPKALQACQLQSSSHSSSAARWSLSSTEEGRSRWHGSSIYSRPETYQQSMLMKGYKSEKGATFSKINSLHESRAFRARMSVCQSIMGLRAFDAFCSLMILGNAVLMGVSADWRAQHYWEPEVPRALVMADRAFSCWFLLELLLRICGHGLSFFVHAKYWSWNVLDFCVVSVDVANMLVDLSSNQEQLTDLLLVRLLRVLRITKALLFVRIFRCFRELRMMVTSVLLAGSSFVWSVALFLLNLFLFSVYFTGQVAAYRRRERPEAEAAEVLENFFGSVARTVYTLFMSVSGGVSWIEISTPLSKVHWTNSAVFTFFIFFTLFALMNIITGLFVDTAIQSAQSDREEVIHAQLQSQHSTLQQMQEILEEADMDKDGIITLEEFESHLNDKQIHAHMEVLGLQLSEARQLFRLLDTGKARAIAIEEFIFGCMRLKGNARSIDIATMMYENKKMHRMLTVFFNYVEREFENLKPVASLFSSNALDVQPAEPSPRGIVARQAL